MNRRSFLASLATLPFVGRLFGPSTETPLATAPPLRSPYANEYRLVRAGEILRKGSLVVWDDTETFAMLGEVPVVRCARDHDDLMMHVPGRAGVTCADLAVWHHGYVQTAGDCFVRVEGV